MLIKSILCLTLLIFTSGVGYGFAKKYRKRKLFFSQLYDLNEKFLQELSYSKRPLKEFIQSCPYKGEFSDLLSEFLLNVGEDCVFQNFFSSITFLDSEEEKDITDFFYYLGRGDSESQKKLFENRLKYYAEKKNNAEENYKKYAELYIKLGVLIGLAIIIVII